MLNVLKVIEYAKTVAIEFEVERGYPDTFTMTWDELLLRLPLDSGRAECVVLATLLLKQKFGSNGSKDKQATDLLDIARKAMQSEEGSPSQ